MTPNSGGALRRALAARALTLFPPMIGQSLLSKRAFRDLYDLELDARIVLSGGNISFKRSLLFEAVRRAYQLPTERCLLRSEQGLEFDVRIERLVLLSQ